MCRPEILFRFAGIFVLASVLLGLLVHPAFFAFTLFVGANLLQTSFTQFCPLERVLGRFGLCGCRPGAA
jgi:hypothetical protein